MRTIVTIARIITGTLFIFSGLVKAIDPRGLGYKMEEFFEVFAREGILPGLMNNLNNHALTFSIIIITLEVVLGVALLIGWKKKFTLWMLLLLMLLFTFLTAFVLFSGKIAACGCFGDCIPITPVQTFTKDVILLFLIILLLIKREYIRPLNKPLILLLIMIIALALTLGLQFYVLKHLPMFDCLPFKKGNNILELRKIPANAVQDKYDYKFVYEKDGVAKEFTANVLPDSTWIFKDRKQVLLVKGSNNVPLINDFKLFAADGSDSTEAVMNNPEEYYLLFLEFPSAHSAEWINDLSSLIASKAGRNKIYVVTSQRSAAESFLSSHNLKPDAVYTCDATAIKTAARANPTLYFLKGAVVQKKYGWADLDEAY